MKECRCCQCRFGVFEGLLALRSPLEGLRFSFQTVVERIEMVRGVFDEATVVVEDPEVALQVLDRFWRFHLLDSGDSVLEGGDAVRVDAITEEVQRFFAEDAFVAVDHEAVLGEDLEDASEVLKMLLRRL